MAGGIDWFRWHHGSVTDPKFGVVAKKSGSRVSDVIAVWVVLLEAASTEAVRGSIGQIDFEAVEHLLGLDDGQAARILDAMTQRGLIVGDGRVASWDKRQPRREDDTAAERKRRQRERDAEKLPQSHEESQVVTIESQVVTQCHDREEESRGEKSQLPLSELSMGETSPTPDKPAPTPKNRQVVMPADFYPNETGVRYAEDRGINIAIELQGMRNWAESKRVLRSSWQATWRTWCDKAVEFGRAGVQANGARASPQFDARSQDRKRAIAELTGQTHEPRIEREINPTLRLAASGVG